MLKPVFVVVSLRAELTPTVVHLPAYMFHNVDKYLQRIKTFVTPTISLCVK